MTSMIHKVVDARSQRRRRYKKYIDVFRERFHCTAGEILGRIESALRTADAEVRSWKAKAEKLEARLAEMEEKHKKEIQELIK